jgi:hypothetical protein
MLDARAIDAVSAHVSPDDFYRPSHGTIFATAVALRNAGEPVDAITVAAALERDGKLADVGGRERLHELAALVPAWRNAGHYARLVRETADLRSLGRAADEISRSVRERSGSAVELRGHANHLLALLEPRAGDSAWLTDAADLLGRPDPGPTRWLVNGLIVAGALVAAVGRWKTMKSYVFLHIAVCVATGRPVFNRFDVPDPGPVVFVMEESGEDALQRRLDALCRGYAIDREELRGRLLVSTDRRVKLDDPGWQARLLATVEREPRMIVFDPIARMKAAGRKVNEQA